MSHGCRRDAWICRMESTQGSCLPAPMPTRAIIYFTPHRRCVRQLEASRNAAAQAVNRKPCAQLSLTDSMMPRLDGQGLGLFARLRPDRRTKPYRGVFAGLLSPQDPPWRLCRRPCRYHTLLRTSRRAAAASCVWRAEPFATTAASGGASPTHASPRAGSPTDPSPAVLDYRGRCKREARKSHILHSRTNPKPTRV